MSEKKEKLGNKYLIEGHGIRVPILGLFPNITNAKIINQDLLWF